MTKEEKTLRDKRDLFLYMRSLYESNLTEAEVQERIDKAKRLINN